MGGLRHEGLLGPRIAWIGPFTGTAESPHHEGADEAFARAAIFAICSAGVGAGEARRTYGRCMAALEGGGTARMGFRHPAKADAIDTIWRDRSRLYHRYAQADDRIAALDTLPGIGPVLKHRLAVALELFEAEERPGPVGGAATTATTEEQTGVVTDAF